MLRTTSLLPRAGMMARRYISAGQRVPKVSGLRVVRNYEVEETDSDKLFANKKVVVFGLPGAFTPVCSGNMLPGYVQKAQDVRAKGIDEIVCITPNDQFVTKAWAKQHETGDKVSFVADGNLALTKALDFVEDMSPHCMGSRSNRYAAVVENGVVKSVFAESKSSEFKVSDVDSLLKQL